MASGQELALLLAVLCQGAGALVVLYVLGMRRVPLVTGKRIPIGEIALSKTPWPEDAQKASNAFDNQFQLPVLLYVAAAVSLYLGTGWLEVTLAWIFVLSRGVHAFIHITDNYVPRRFLVYTFGYSVLCLFWLWLIGRIVVLQVSA